MGCQISKVSNELDRAVRYSSSGRTLENSRSKSPSSTGLTYLHSVIVLEILEGTIETWLVDLTFESRYSSLRFTVRNRSGNLSLKQLVYTYSSRSVFGCNRGP